MDLANIHKLQVFTHVAESLSITRAAESLMVSQPAVSRQIQELERAIGVPLFDRVGRRLALTDAGLALLKHALALQDLLGNMEIEMAGMTGGVAGSLRLGASTVWEYVLPRWMGGFRATHPRVTLDVAVGNTHQTITLMLRNEIHLGFVGERPREDGLETLYVMDDEIIVVAAPNHPLATGARVQPALLNTASWVQREADSATARIGANYLQGLGIKARAAMELGSHEALKGAVRAGFGIGMISRNAVTQELAGGALVLVRLDAPPCTRPLYALRSKRRFFSPTQQAFLAHVMEMAGRAGGQPVAGIP